MADALVTPLVGVSMYVCSSLAAAYSLKQTKQENNYQLLPIMGVMGAFVFAVQMVNFSIPGTGASGHLIGGMMLSAILGPYAGFLTLIGILCIQCLLFADGGLLALGCNIWNMAFYGCFIGALVIWKFVMRDGISKKKIAIASILGAIVTLQLGAFSVTIETLASSITDLPFSVFVATMQPIHLAIGLIEGLITSAILCFIYEARPELLWTGRMSDNDILLKPAKFSYQQTIITLLIAFIIIGGGISLFASSHPDGLEWSIKKITGSIAPVSSSSTIYALIEKIQGTTALLPDYSFKHSKSAMGTSFSGILGGVVVITFLFVVKYIFRLIRKK